MQWGGALDHFADGAEIRADAVELHKLAAAYTTFFDEAEQGGFGTAPDGEWDADQVLAHMALNDLAIVATCQSLVHQEPTPSFANQVCQEPDARDVRKRRPFHLDRTQSVLRDWFVRQ